jgi:hypothetical protein
MTGYDAVNSYEEWMHFMLLNSFVSVPENDCFWWLESDFKSEPILSICLEGLKKTVQIRGPNSHYPDRNLIG